MSDSGFSSLPLSEALLRAVAALDYVEMTPVQAQALPPVLDGRDVIAQAHTGSGKTVVFGLGLLARLDPSIARLQGLVLCPTRELADQVSKEIRRLAAFIPNVKLLTLCGGTPLAPQVASLGQHDPHLVVGTPGRVQELMRKKLLHLAGVTTLVLDEADRMLDMGFEAAVMEIVGKVGQKRQTLLFSATFPDAIRGLSEKLQREAVTVTVDDVEDAPEIEQRAYEVDIPNKPAALAALLAAEGSTRAIVFCNTRRDVEDVATALQNSGFDALALHGELEQREREERLVCFMQHSCTVLVATDVAARGLDVPELDLVVSYELSPDPDVHRHRIGRTGRAGRAGLALALCAPREVGRAHAIEAQLGTTLRWLRVPAPERASTARGAAPMVSLRIDAGRSDKLRPGDILGALTGEGGLKGDAVGRIDIFAIRAYVAVRRSEANAALKRLSEGKIKGRRFRVRRVERG
jgi:ATP-dependent RNA helicase DbpA